MEIGHKRYENMVSCDDNRTENQLHKGHT
jgi:hypothetical protein